MLPCPVCFDIRDDFDPSLPPDRPPLLHFGCITPEASWMGTSRHVKLSGGATLFYTLVADPPSPPVPPPVPPHLPFPPCPPPSSPPPYDACDSSWCKTYESWVNTDDSKFLRMWGSAWDFTKPGQRGCFDRFGGQRWFDGIFEGTWCDRNWLQGTAGQPRANDRPHFTAPAPALLGFDETILGYCSQLVGLWFDGGDLNTELADRCVRANKNVLRLMSGSSPWDMCQNIEWQLCAIRGKLPGQDAAKISFASAPRDLELKWWTDVNTHPTYAPKPDGYALGDVFFAELCVTFTICKNRGDLFRLDVGETFVCDMDPAGWNLLTSRFLQHRSGYSE